jgi:hypothetical protein
MDNSELAAVFSLSGVVITALLTTLTAIRSGKDRRERTADRRRIEEETTDVILKRVRRELDRAYEVIDIKDRKLRLCTRFIHVNREQFATLGIEVPDLDIDEGPTVRDEARRVRFEIDTAADDAREDDLLDRDGPP